MRNLYLLIILLVIISCNKDHYDYRDKIAGKYKCTYKHYYWEISADSLQIFTTIDTLIVSKNINNEIKILSNSFALDENWSFHWMGDGSNQIDAQFFPDKDSISYFFSRGGLGGGYRAFYDGNKISE